MSRESVIQPFLAQVRAIHERGVDRAALQQIVTLLEALANQRELFNFERFPAPDAASGETQFRYRLNDDGESPTLYVNSLLPGKATLPHNHETWAIIVAVEGQELNRVYRRADDGSDPTRAQLALEREIIVQPGTSVAFLGEDLHGIRVEGQTPTLHFHLYGRPLESLDHRYGVKDDGSVVNYNKSQMAPSIEAYGL
ncbi:cysteine dioxygenase family protein [Pseudomonas putida]|uniref:Cysteine dioxygenase family protein n=1 Tax=Pseudomonas putida TaxID=303 RepID=A0A7W2L0N4_PSEPU|nr:MULTISPECIES: cysteine dioxygenase family protein [Pseudomonas]MBA6116265.1 cysteine dioxygenase family protein [Pseudomonas putida]MBI6942777.1 cysteine dioxygenase family protein [Pseudomonas putida]MBI6958824.1 cysteine dioxygenase family protein [Pseudomonas putida]MCZ9639147.1 cysteine dioxygenase family protein [Pseudomonas putida]MEC4874910.1 cysteine dioxygenase family protein [Pseudomonas sp. NC26]